MKIKQAIETAAKYAHTTKDPIPKWSSTIQMIDGRVIAHDLKSGVICETDFNVGKIAVDAKQIQRSIKASGDDINILLNNDSLEITGSGGRFKVPTVDLDDIPKIKEPPDDVKWVKMSSEEMKVIKNVSWPRSDDVSRPNLRGVYFYKKFISSMNGHCMCRYELNRNIPEELGIDYEISIIPDSLFSLTKDVEVCIYDNNFFVKAKDETHMVPIIDCKMPPIDDIIDKTKKFNKINVNRKDLLSTISRASIVDKSGSVIIELNGNKLAISSEDKNTSFSFNHTMDIFNRDESVNDGCICINNEYLIDAIDCIDFDLLSIKVNWNKEGSIDPMLIEGNKYISVIMPIRI